MIENIYDKLEPGCLMLPINDAARLSTAISLKRIADVGEQLAKMPTIFEVKPLN